MMQLHPKIDRRTFLVAGVSTVVKNSIDSAQTVTRIDRDFKNTIESRSGQRNRAILWGHVHYAG